MAGDQLLSEVLREFARTMVMDVPIQVILDHLVRRSAEVLPISAARVTIVPPGAGPRYVAASDGAARALEMGVAAAFAFPLRYDHHQLGTLLLYRDTPGTLDVAAREAAQTLADVAAAYIVNAQARAALLDTSDRAQRMGLHDPLTGLPNRVLFLERLDHAVRRSRRSGHTAAVLFADLDRFKLVNDVYGHHAGDELLVAVAQRLATVLRPGDTLARLAGDEFVILCEDLDTVARADAIAARIGDVLTAPFLLDVAEIEVTASVGIAFLGRDDQLPEELLRDADMAMYQAKRRGGARHQVIDLSEKCYTLRQVNLERELRGAATRGELRLEYQPIVATGNGRMTGVEALLRWNHPTQGLVAPSALVPIAERSGLINEIGQWVLAQACLDRHSDKGRSIDRLAVSVNVSGRQLMCPGFPATVAGVLSDTGTDPELVTLEVTESVFVQDSGRALAVLAELKDLGLKIALDDFGTGYSSLQYLKQFPIDIVKIDQKFVCDLEHDAASHAIVYTVVELAHVLGMTAVAEGVETAEQHRQLLSIGCDFCQGFYFAHPLPAEDLDSLTNPSLGLHPPVLPLQHTRRAV
ncbi:MAG TPA: bifunctional diguanylate cyclase/phosphodiesterase [Acidimicrobiia bacterium]|nr:bifunctional diguanylate cyclase/phosphodiesterase [Acidimicrobiia bacterium]